MHFVPASISSELKDGTQLLLREVSIADRERALDAFDRLSADDVAMRFWRDLINLDESLLDRLTRADQINHLAWCALNPDRMDEPGYGAGSVWRLKEDHQVGEVSLTVIPEYQGRGVGLVLFALLWVLARLLGMRTLRANVLVANHRAVSWFTNLGGELHSHGAFYEIDFNLLVRNQIECDHQKALYQWIELFDREFSGKL